MNATTNDANYKNRSRVIAIIGVVLLLGGIAVGFLGPLEMYCFYLFSEGGRFHYAGFGFGSFMFGNIASQIVGYYLLAALFIPLGYGHIKGILLLDFSIACLVCLLWGTLRLKLWAWWVSVIWLGLFTVSVVLTFFRYDYAAILAGLAFPSREMEFLGGIPIQGYHFSVLVGIPLLITWVIAILSRRHFGRSDQILDG
jgi:hypothetical protein